MEKTIQVANYPVSTRLFMMGSFRMLTEDWMKQSKKSTTNNKATQIVIDKFK